MYLTVIRIFTFILVLIFSISINDTIAQTLPFNQRPEWLQRDGLIMAGSWEPLTYRTLQGTRDGHAPTEEELAAWEHEHDSVTTAKIKELGVNFIMMHCYKGAGLKIEYQTMQDAVRFAKQYHDAGLHVGVYVYSGAFLWEPFFREVPEATNWIYLDKNYKPYDYYNLGIRYYWDRNHPAAQEYYKKIINFAVNDIQTELLHFDNYGRGPGRDANSVNRFREYLRDNFTLQQLQQMGATDLSLVIPPMNETPQNLLDYAWLEFATQSVADSYSDMNKYARSLRKDILMELNCGGPGNRIRPPFDHGRLLQGGEALWSEGFPSGYKDGQFQTRILSYKIARSMKNLVFYYATTPVSISESMAFNSDCLGMVCEFINGDIISARPPKEPVSKEILPYINFYKTRRTLFREANVIADVAILRSFPSQVFADPANAQLTAKVEQLCIDERIPFQTVHEHQLSDLHQYRSLVLAGCVALSDKQILEILRFVGQGGNLCVIGPVANYNEWMVARQGVPLKDVPERQMVKINDDGNILDALHQSVGGRYSAFASGQEGLYAEYTEVPNQRLVHLVNFRPESPVKNVKVTMQIPDGKKAKRVLLACPTQNEDMPIKFSQKGSEISFTVPEVGVYKIGIVEL